MQVKRVAGEQGNRARALMSQLSGLLTEGAVTADTLLDSVPRILSVVRESNVALRWLFLHMAVLPPAVALVIKLLTQSLRERCMKKKVKNTIGDEGSTAL